MFYASNICINNGFGFGGFGFMPFYSSYPFCSITTPYFCQRPLFYGGYSTYYSGYSSAFTGAFAGAALGSALGNLLCHRA